MTIYLIGGPPKCGKTTLAKALSKRLGIPWTSADTLQNIVAAYMSEEQQAAAFPHSYLRGETNDEFYSVNSADEIVQGYIEQGRTSYRAIQMVAETQLVDEDDYIIEGYQVTPEVVDLILKQHGAGKVRTIFLYKKDVEQFVNDIHKSTTPNDWILRKTKEEGTFVKIAEMAARYSEYFEREARSYGFNTLSMDGEFEAQIEKALAQLTR